MGPGMGVLTQYLLQRPEADLRCVEIDTESVDYLMVHFQKLHGRLLEADFLNSNLRTSSVLIFCFLLMTAHLISVHLSASTTESILLMSIFVS